MQPDIPQTEAAIVEMTNAFRKENRLGEVKPNAVLAAAARAFAAYLAKTGTFAHEADGRQPHQRAEAQGYRYCFIAENLALNLDSRGFETRKLATVAMDGWKTSPGHRANMLEPGVTEIGVGIARAPDKVAKFISVQLFGRPEALKVAFSIQNQTGIAVRYSIDTEQETLSPRSTVSYTTCEPGQLSVEKKAGQQVRFTPRDGDRFVIDATASGSVEVTVTRK